MNHRMKYKHQSISRLVNTGIVNTGPRQPVFTIIPGNKMWHSIRFVVSTRKWHRELLKGQCSVKRATRWLGAYGVALRKHPKDVLM